MPLADGSQMPMKTGRLNEDGVRWVEKALALQMSHREIVAKAAVKFGCAERTAYRWIAKVYERMEKQAVREKPMRRQQMVLSLRTIMQRAMETNDLRAAIAALDRICRLYGLYDDQLSIRGTVGIGLGLAAMGFKSPAEVRGRIDELKARLANGGPISAGYLPATSGGAPSNGGAPSGGNGRSHGGDISDLDLDDDSGSGNGNGRGNGRGGNGHAVE